MHSAFKQYLARRSGSAQECIFTINMYWVKSYLHRFHYFPSVRYFLMFPSYSCGKDSNVHSLKKKKKEKLG